MAGSYIAGVSSWRFLPLHETLTMRMFLSIAALLWMSSVSLPAVAAGRPNVLLICVDDLKPALGCYGDVLAKTPAIDRLAGQGVVIQRAYCNQAVCSPSRNALLTSLRPQTLGIYDLPTHFRYSQADAVTLPQWFREQGWHSEGMGKIFHVGHGNTDDAQSWSVPSWRPKAATYAQEENQAVSSVGSNTKKKNQNQNASNAPRVYGTAFEAADVADNFYHDGAVADHAVSRLQAFKQQTDQPFFLAVGFIRPHLPFVAPQRDWELYDRSMFAVSKVTEPPAGAPGYAPQFGGELRQYRDIPKQGALPVELQRTLIHGYYAATTYMDRQVGRVLDELDRLKLRESTIVVLWGDHGWHLGDHGIWCKHTNYEQAAHIPLIVSAPGIAAGKSAALVETVDIAPTLCALAGLPQPEGWEGRSFAGVLQDPAAAHRDHVIHVYPRNRPEAGSVLGRAIRTDRYRLVEWRKIGAPEESAEWELYDYEADPLEQRNLVTDLPAVAAELRQMLTAHPTPKPQIRPAATNTP